MDTAHVLCLLMGVIPRYDEDQGGNVYLKRDESWYILDLCGNAYLKTNLYPT
jgi:hypothetical protein